MKRIVILTLATFALASPALAAGACSTAPQSAWQPQAKLEDMLRADGMTIVQIKVESGCYEVYAKDKNGNRVNAAYNAETLEKLENAEAGEG